MIIILQRFQGFFANALIAFDMESAGKTNTEHSPVLCNKRPLSPYHLAEGIHKTGCIPAGKDYVYTLIHKRPDRFDSTSMYTAGRIRYRPVNIGKECL
jgi:hypothetical protein